MSPIRILLADDHTVVRKGLRLLLESQPEFVVVADAADGREAVALAEQHRPDVAVIDIAMPVLNGIEAARQISAKLPQTAVERARGALESRIGPLDGAATRRAAALIRELIDGSPAAAT